MARHQIRELSTLEEMEKAAELQRTVWNDESAVVYPHMLISMQRSGSPILGAWDGDQLIGFLLSYFGLESPDADRPAMANLKLVSQRMAVDPQYRDAGIGYDLKLSQRQVAIRLGIRLVTWTFDPLLSRNAHLNIRKLGAIVREYARDYYGDVSPVLSSHGYSDRFIVEWWVTNNRVEQRLSNRRTGLTLEQYLDSEVLIMNPSRPALRGYVQPSEKITMPPSQLAMIEIPDNIADIRDDDPDLAKEWQLHMREVFESAFTAGFVVTDYVRGYYDGRDRNYYVISHADAVLGRLIN